MFIKSGSTMNSFLTIFYKVVTPVFIVLVVSAIAWRYYTLSITNKPYEAIAIKSCKSTGYKLKSYKVKEFTRAYTKDKFKLVISECHGGFSTYNEVK